MTPFKPLSRSKQPLLSTAPLSTQRPKSPPSTRKQPRKLPDDVSTLQKFLITHNAVQARIEEYVDYPRRNFVHLNYDLRERWKEKYLNAGSPLARCEFARIAINAAKAAVDTTGELFFVTVTPRDYVLPLADAYRVNLRSLQALTRQAIGPNASLISMIEAALYKEWGPNGPSPRHDHVSWHPHSLVWNTTRQKLERAARSIARHTSLTGRRAVHIKAVQPDELEAYLGYMLKIPLKEYHLNRRRGEHVDPETGEVFLNYRQQKRELRTGDRVRLENLFEDIYLDQLLFGQHEGSPIVRQIKDEALRDWHWEERRREYVRAHSFAARRFAA